VVEEGALNRFLLFAGDAYYPGGGWEDFVKAFPTLEEVQQAGKEIGRRQWWHIVDLEQLKMTHES
jgi:hypothetical protein